MRAWKAMAALALVTGCGSSYGGGSAAPPQAACTAANATPLTTATVTMPGMSFSPSCASVAAGTQVTFVNDDAVYSPHTVTWDPGQATTADSGPLANGAHFQHTFTTAGTEHIHCTFHEAMGMRMTVIVQ